MNLKHVSLRLMDSVMSPKGQQRFVTSLSKMKLKLPHCDRGAERTPQGERNSTHRQTRQLSLNKRSSGGVALISW